MDRALEDELASRIDPWLQHMRWRADFARWRTGRIWQEREQDGRITTIQRYTGSLDRRSVLEIGSGMGGLSVALALRGAHPIATEFNRDYCRIIKLRAARYMLPLPVIGAAGEALPFTARVFNLVVCWDIVEHVRDPDQLLAELQRVVRPGGLVFLTIINRFAWRDPHYHLPAINYAPRRLAEAIIRWRGRSKAGSAFRDKQRLSEMHYFTFGGFKRRAGQHGFRLLDIREDNVRRGVGTATGIKGRMRDVLELLGLALPTYHMYRAFVQGTYELVLQRTTEA